MNVSLWGPSMWTLLQNVAFLLDEKKIGCISIYKSLEVLLPCIHCRHSYKEFYAEYSDPVPGSYANWVYRMHSRVNSKLESQQMDKALQNVDSAFYRGSIRVFLQKSRNIIYKEPSFEVVEKRFRMNFEDPVPKRDITTILLALATNYNQELHKQPLLHWIDCIYEVLPKEELKIFQEAIRNNANLLNTAIQLKYGSIDENSKYAASLMKAGSCLKNTCT